jgi:hypothetical protein
MRAIRLQWLVTFAFLTSSTFGFACAILGWGDAAYLDYYSMSPMTVDFDLPGFLLANLCLLGSTVLPGWWLRRRRVPLVRRSVDREVGYRMSGRRVEVTPNIDAIHAAQVYVCKMQTAFGLAVCIGISLMGYAHIRHTFHTPPQLPIGWWAFVLLGWMGCVMHWPRLQRPASSGLRRRQVTSLGAR